MSSSFYDQVKTLDQYKRSQNPSQKNLEELFVLLNKDIALKKYFFDSLENSNWVLLLHANGMFIAPPQPISVDLEPGYIQFPRWYEGEYLTNFAKEFPEIVKETALSIRTENPRAFSVMLDALLLIPSDIAAQVVPAIREWADSKYAHTMTLEYSMARVMEHLAQEGQGDAALEILEIISEPLIPDRSEDGIIEATSKFDNYWLQQALNIQLLPLIKTQPLAIISILQKHLKNAIDNEVRPNVEDNKSISYWRLNINPNVEGYSRQDNKNLLVTSIINVLSTACDQGRDGVEDVLRHYLNSDYDILRRIAIHILRYKGSRYTDLVNETYEAIRSNPLRHFSSEFKFFINEQFPNFSDDIQREIIDGILSLESDPKFIERMDRDLVHYSDQLLGDSRNEKRRIYIERAKLDRLGPISKYLTGKDKEVYERLKKDYGEPIEPEESGIVTTWSGPNSPYKDGELLKKSIEEIIGILLAYVPEGDKFDGSPSREGLGRDFQKVVESRSDEFAQDANLFINGELRTGYHYHFFRGLEEALKEERLFELDGVVQLAQYVCEKTGDVYPLEDMEPGLQTAKNSIASFFTKVFQVKGILLEVDTLKIVEDLIQKLVWVDEEYDPLKRSPEEIAEEKAYDASTKALNTIRGEAMHALMGLELYKARIRREELGKDADPIFDEWAKEIIIEKFDKSKDASLAVHSVIGQYVPQLTYLDKEWVVERLPQIFPDDESHKQYWRAAWSAYVGFSDVYTSVFPGLLPYYQRAVSALPYEDMENPYIQIDQALASHILKAYLLELIELDSADELVSKFYENADDNVRSHGGFWLSKVMEYQEPKAEDKTWQRIWNLWQRRLSVAVSDPENQTKYRKEISDYLRLLKNVPVDLSALVDTIRSTLPFMDRQEFEVSLILDYLSDQCGKFPDLAVSLLHEVIISSEGLHLLPDMKKNMAVIFEAAVNAPPDAKQKVIEIINILGVRGDYSWRPWLEKMN